MLKKIYFPILYKTYHIICEITKDDVIWDRQSTILPRGLVVLDNLITSTVTCVCVWLCSVYSPMIDDESTLRRARIKLKKDIECKKSQWETLSNQ